MLAFPQPRYRIYASATNYAKTARDFLTNRVTAGDATSNFEAAVAKFVGVRHAVCMPQARVAIYCAIRSLVTPGRKVILSPYTIHDVINMVISAGGQPVFADIERETCNIDPAEIEALADGDTAAVLITHLHGLACDVERIAAFCRLRGIPLLEDSAQAFGTAVAGRRTGSFGRAGVFSFGMAKNVNSFYGGMLVTDDDQLAADVRRQIADLPFMNSDMLLKRALFCLVGDVITTRPVFWSSTYWLFRFGYLKDVDALNRVWRGEMDPQLKSQIPPTYLRRMTSLQARMAEGQIAQVDQDTKTRVGYARIYHEGLRDLPEVILPPQRDDGSHIYLTYPIQVPDRHALNRYMMRNCQDITIQHLTNTADVPCYAAWHRDCPNARATADQVLLLPTYPSYGERDVHRNVRLVREFFGRQ